MNANVEKLFKGNSLANFQAWAGMPRLAGRMPGADILNKRKSDGLAATGCWQKGKSSEMYWIRTSDLYPVKVAL
jgi:hypothetical protein